MPDNSFDIVSKIDLAEVNNAIQQAMKEVSTRFDLKDSKSKIEHGRHRRDHAALRRRVQDEGGQRRLPAKAGQTRCAAERLDLRRRRNGRRKHGKTENHPAAGYSDRKSARDREAGQELKEKSASLDSGAMWSESAAKIATRCRRSSPWSSNRISASICNSQIIEAIRKEVEPQRMRRQGSIIEEQAR